MGNQTMFGPGGGGAEQRKKWLDKYGFPRLVGTGGIFYADQLSTDAEPSGGFNMGKSGSIWPVPEVVKEGQYGGVMGWGMKKKGPAIDNLPKEKIYMDCFRKKFSILPSALLANFKSGM